MKKLSFLACILLLGGCASQPSNKELTFDNTAQNQKVLVEMGQALFFDPNLSKNRTQACATCHNPDAGFADNRDNGVNAMASLGDDGKSIGDRQAPTATYAKFSPLFHYDKKLKEYVGGQFWDGREPSLEGQAGGPPLNPIEMGMSDKKSVVDRIKENDYYVTSFKTLWGDKIFDDNDKAYLAMTQAIGAFEKTDEFSPFDSKYDRYLRGEYDLTLLEDLGMSLFFSNNNTNCSTCHKLHEEGNPLETFTNFQYRNIGVPANEKLRTKNGVKDIDKGLLANPAVSQKEHEGKHKVPTLRNVAVTPPYMHNGIFKDLRTVMEFYDKYNNTQRNINPETNKPWADPEVAHSIALDELKAKKLTDRKIDALIAFLETLTDKRYEHLLKKDK